MLDGSLVTRTIKSVRQDDVAMASHIGGKTPHTMRITKQPAMNL